ncbi:MAG TPA: SH3 domain-containing C40 family peptidase, partial [Bacillota bacterium]|nr:SH3 domain-containing C40 family peptidase [Bacillota bacterium]
ADEKSTFPTGLIITATVSMRNIPNNSATVITTVSGRQIITITEQYGLWYKVKLDNGLVGWIPKTYIATDADTVATQKHSPERLVEFAKKYLNTVYVYGGNSPKGFDCSGFTRFVYTKFGYYIPHRSQDQMNLGIPVSRKNLVPADLVFFSTSKTRKVNHVGIYIGEGKFIHASSGSRRVRINTLNEAYYKTRYQGARRVLIKLNSLSLISKL